MSQRRQALWLVAFVATYNPFSVYLFTESVAAGVILGTSSVIAMLVVINDLVSSSIRLAWSLGKTSSLDEREYRDG
jgi:hypothetical protein